jgi:non-reducing end alpha-L-arabinofuranosidase
MRASQLLIAVSATVALPMASLLALVALLFSVTPGGLMRPTAAHAQTQYTISPGNYQIRLTESGGQGNCLDDTDFSSSAGTQMQLYGCSGELNQSWYIHQVRLSGGQVGYQIKNRHSELCLDVHHNSMNSGTSAVQYPCNAEDLAQLFYFGDNCNNNWGGCSAGFHIQADQGHWFGGNCLDIPNNNQHWGAPLWFWTCSGPPSQGWSLNPGS